ncbi:MAG TPA: glycosyltransferase, partial [Gemmatimonadales bacterium]|nr:glycosyltransferase [Gemmatimonadales bacterium]
PEKGLDLAFEAVKLARSRAKSRVILAVAGDGPYANECRSRAPFDTMFTGRLSGTALSAFYASADIFLFPSRTDTFGNVLLEAMASRLAVVAADSPPSRELLEWDSPGEIAGIVASPDAASVASELVRLADDPDVRRALAASGYARAATRTWDSAHAPLLADYATLAAGRR